MKKKSNADHIETALTMMVLATLLQDTPTEVLYRLLPDAMKRAITAAALEVASRPRSRQKDAARCALVNILRQQGIPAIRHVTLFRGVTQAARRAGVSQSHLSRVLRGERAPGSALERKLRKMGIKLQKEAV